MSETEPESFSDVDSALLDVDLFLKYSALDAPLNDCEKPSTETRVRCSSANAFDPLQLNQTRGMCTSVSCIGKHFILNARTSKPLMTG